MQEAAAINVALSLDWSVLFPVGCHGALHLQTSLHAIITSQYAKKDDVRVVCADVLAL